MPRPLAARAAAVACIALLGGCGHPATRAECDEILDKVVALEARGQNITDPAAVAARVAEVRKSKGDELTNRCIGRRITGAMMTCVRNAASFDEIDNRCLR